MDMHEHANQSKAMRQAAEYAEGIAANLRQINSGPVFDHDRDKLVREVDGWFSMLAKLLGKDVAS